ncbi:hypothetical protein NM208_g4786 [Fusarium decemcellulare]|uniref:Uncharacterized protein n=1 Tax=Fusarium decemcellulare TaxID=57161 RepID=A0ACC1SJL8_9HYPO|nr:hypothetical protein NM208_g4786 [Fusarium decemcellulare]
MTSDSKPESSMLWCGRFTALQEGIHTANERRLGEIIGKNLRDKLRKIDEYLINFLKLVAARAESEMEHIMPSYSSILSPSGRATGCSPTVSPDLERLRETIKRVNRSPLGRSALVGNPFDVDRDMMAEELGFEGLLWNSMGGVADRDFVTELFQWGSMLMQHISR